MSLGGRMNLGKILKGYGALVSSLLSFVLIALSCVLVGLAISYPLWFIATTSAKTYTILSLSLFGCAIIGLLLSRIVKGYKKSPRRLFISIAKKVTLIAGFVIFCALILNFYKALAIVAIILTLIIYGILAFGISHDSRKSN